MLAAGSGRRLAPVTGNTPKQFWAPRGHASLLEETVDRLKPVAPASRTIIVVDRSHRAFVESLPLPSRLGRVVYQPQDRGTAAGVLFGVTALLQAAPNALVVMTPSDHGVANQAVFQSGFKVAIHHVRRGASDVVLLGVQPDRACSDYGWIVPGSSEPPRRLASVASFVEKPQVAVAEQLLAVGAVWNTMVLVAKASAIIDLFRRHLPDLWEVFETAGELPDAQREAFLSVAYAALPRHDFSSDLLARARGLSLVVWPSALGWSDLGTPERLYSWEEHRVAPLARHAPSPAA